MEELAHRTFEPSSRTPNEEILFPNPSSQLSPHRDSSPTSFTMKDLDTVKQLTITKDIEVVTTRDIESETIKDDDSNDIGAIQSSITKSIDLPTNIDSTTIGLPTTHLSTTELNTIRMSSIDSKKAHGINMHQNFHQFLLQLQHIQLDQTALLQNNSFSNIPSFLYDKTKPADPIKFVENNAENGSKYGAIKLGLDSLHSYTMDRYLALDPDTFTLVPKKVFSRTKNDLFERLSFYHELIKLNRSQHDSILHDLKCPVTPAASQDILSSDVRTSEETLLTPVSSDFPDSLKENNIHTSSENNIQTSLKNIQNKSTKKLLPSIPIKQETVHLDHLHLSKTNQWNTIPTLNNIPLDLYSLYQIVTREGGYLKVNSENSWQKIADSMNLRAAPEILTSVLSETYFKILYPYEQAISASILPVLNTPFSSNTEELHGAKSGLFEGKDIISSHPNGHDILAVSNVLAVLEYHPSKRQKLNPVDSFIQTPSPSLIRTIQAKASKGFLVESTHLLKIKSAILHSVENAAQKCPQQFDPNDQLENYFQWLLKRMNLFNDSVNDLLPNGDNSSTLMQIIKQDLAHQDELIRFIKANFDSQEKTSIDELNSTPFKVTSEILEQTLQSLLTGPLFLDDIVVSNDIPFCMNQIGSPRFGDDNSKFVLKVQSIKTNASSNDKTQPFIQPIVTTLLDKNETAGIPISNSQELNHPPDFETMALNPFNIHNLPHLPNSLLGALNENDLNRKNFTSVSLNVATTLSLENWKCEDHFTQSCDYLVAGACKRWYFIPELEFAKYEQLVQDFNQDSNTVLDLSIGKETIEHNIHQILNEDHSTLEYECLINSLDCMVGEVPEIRMDLKNSKFQAIIDRKKACQPLNRGIFITPAMLKKHGINFTTTIQRPGEMIYKYPKTYSCSISTGVSISERVNFASKLWLDYSQAAETWLAQRGLLPNFLVFKLCVNLAHLLDSSVGTPPHFENDLYLKISHLYSRMLDRELELRNSIRKLIKVKEVILDERPYADLLCDVDFLYAYPSKVLILNSSSATLNMSLGNFLEYLDCLESPVNNLSSLDVLKDKGTKLELHLFYSDEKLKSFRRLLQEFSMDFVSWQRRYSQLISSEEEVTLRSYKNLLSEGQKIQTALTGISESYLFFTSHNSNDASGKTFGENISVFRKQLSELKIFFDRSSEIVEQCQAVLALKHQQRIRNGASTDQPTDVHSDDGASLQLLVELTNKIPKLGFYAPEFEQVFEFRNEIESFDRACRQLLGQSSTSMADIQDMVSLGLSFGIVVPSLLYLIRLRDKLEWNKTYDTIISGGDPFSGKKEIFLLPDLERFREKGSQCLSQDESEKLNIIDQYINVGQDLDRSVQEFIKENQILNSVDLKTLEGIMTDMEDRVKLSGSKRLFVYLSTYLKLVDLKSQESYIKFLQSFDHKQHSLFDVKQMVSELKTLPFKFDTRDIDASVEEGEMWLKQVESLIEPVKIRRLTSASSGNIKQACNMKVASKLKNIVENCQLVFSDHIADPIEQSSPFMFYNQSEEAMESQAQVRYCICRDFEGGSMIECDRCHEWFHFNCVTHLGPISENEDEKYSCPACLVVVKFASSGLIPDLPDKIPETQLMLLINSAAGLKVQPVREYSLLKELDEVVFGFKNWSSSRPEQEQTGLKATLLDELMCRKLIGSPVAIEPLLNRCLHKLSRAVKPIQNENDVSVNGRNNSSGSGATGLTKEPVSTKPTIIKQSSPKDEDVTISEDSSLDMSNLEELNGGGLATDSANVLDCLVQKRLNISPDDKRIQELSYPLKAYPEGEPSRIVDLPSVYNLLPSQGTPQHSVHSTPAKSSPEVASSVTFVQEALKEPAEKPMELDFEGSKSDQRNQSSDQLPSLNEHKPDQMEQYSDKQSDIQPDEQAHQLEQQAKPDQHPEQPDQQQDEQPDQET